MNQEQITRLSTFQREAVADLSKSFKCVNDTVLIRKINNTGDIASSKGILLPGQVTNDITFGILCATGNKVPDYYLPGLKVHYNPNAKLEIYIDGAPYLCMSYKEIRLFVDSDFSKAAHEIYVPTENNVMVMATPVGRQKTASGIEIPDAVNKHNHTGMVSALGTNVTEFELGNFILFQSYVDSTVMLKDFDSSKPFAIFDKNFVIGVMAGDTYVWDKSLTWEEKERERRLKEFAKKSGYYLDGKEA